MKKDANALTSCFGLFDLHELSYQKPYHHPIALLHEQSGWNSQCETSLPTPMDRFHRTSPTQLSEHLSVMRP